MYNNHFYRPIRTGKQLNFQIDFVRHYINDRPFDVIHKSIIIGTYLNVWFCRILLSSSWEILDAVILFLYSSRRICLLVLLAVKFRTSGRNRLGAGIASPFIDEDIQEEPGDVCCAGSAQQLPPISRSHPSKRSAWNCSVLLWCGGIAAYQSWMRYNIKRKRKTLKLFFIFFSSDLMRVPECSSLIVVWNAQPKKLAFSQIGETSRRSKIHHDSLFINCIIIIITYTLIAKSNTRMLRIHPAPWAPNGDRKLRNFNSFNNIKTKDFLFVSLCRIPGQLAYRMLYRLYRYLMAFVYLHS